jgi:hypothetical protein
MGIWVKYSSTGGRLELQPWAGTLALSKVAGQKEGWCSSGSGAAELPGCDAVTTLTTFSNRGLALRERILLLSFGSASTSQSVHCRR